MQFLLSVIFIAFVSVSCVGTVQESTEPLSDIGHPDPKSITFYGVQSVLPISDSRIEVYFYPAEGAGEFVTYDVYVSNEILPRSFTSSTMVPDYRGLLKVTLTDLLPNTSYSIRVEARDLNNTVRSNSNVTLSGVTFVNRVANFNGITSVANLSGQDGKDSIRVTWSHAQLSGNIFSTVDWDPKAYEIVAIDSTRLSIPDMDRNELGAADGRWVNLVDYNANTTSYVVRGLPTKRKIHLRVRALHNGSIDNLFVPSDRSELNNNYLTISTLSDSLADILFNEESFAVRIGSGNSGLTSAIGSWTKAIGVFDHFRIYYAEVNSGGVTSFPAFCLPKTQTVTGSTYCKSATPSETSAQITDLNPYTDYDMVLVICQTPACLDGERRFSTHRLVKTDPSLPNFSGIESISLASTEEEVGTLKLKFTLPDFSNGFIDSYNIYINEAVDGSDYARLTLPVGDTSINSAYSSLRHRPYNVFTDSEIVLENVIYSPDQNYCVKMVPVKNINGIPTEFPNGMNRLCVKDKYDGTEIIAPDASEFKGIKSSYTEKGLLTVSWDEATSGVFQEYEIFIAKPSLLNPMIASTFTFIEAQNAADTFDNSKYLRYLVSKSSNEINISGLPDGIYIVGMKTIFSSVTDNGPLKERSEDNPEVYSCEVNSSYPDVIQCTK